ncbi:hypothetical protein [Streptomyces sp. NPDC002545]
MRRHRVLATGKLTIERVHAVTDLTEHQECTREHWGVEALHHLRDVTLREDASTIHTGTPPRPACATRPSPSPNSPAGAITPPRSITTGRIPTADSA